MSSNYSFRLPSCSDVFSEVRSFAENFVKGAKEGLTSFIPLSIGASLIASAYLEKGYECSFKTYIVENVDYPFMEVVVNAPIWEETIFRQIFQKVFIPSIWHISVKIAEPNNTFLLNRKIKKIVRYSFSALLFAGAHLYGGNSSTRSYQQLQSIAAFFIGLKLSQIAESRLDYAGAVGAHSLNNFICYLGMKYFCS